MEVNTAQIKKRINIELPQIIVEKLDVMARRASASRNELIRRLISEKIEEKEKADFEQAMKTGYLENYDFIARSSGEWDFTLEDDL